MPSSPRLPAGNPARPNPALGASALSRLLWVAGALLVLWLTLFWATR